jgi:hypothetical protein
MQVGVNYPWRDYGWDFGEAPPGWREAGAAPRWTADIDAHLEHLRGLGIEVVRWFVLADGLTYGTGEAAPRTGADEAWYFDPVAVSVQCLDHFEELLRRIEVSNLRHDRAVQLLPVLIDFHFCHPGQRVTDGWVKGGRASVIASRFNHSSFFDGVLEPLLAVSQRHPHTIYAWEVMNEPEWVTLGWDPQLWRTPPVDDATMREFLDEGCTRIRRSGFRSTIGFALRETLLSSASGSDIDQFHYYPAGARDLGRSPERGRYPAILGEFATATSDTWPELPDWDQSVLNRLRLAADNGYPLAIPWSFLARDRHTSWSNAVERDIESFAQQQNGPAASRL